MMKPLWIGFTTLAFLIMTSSMIPMQAQTMANTDSAARPGYDAGDEVTLSGTVSRVVTNASPGMIPGAHLLLATPDGPVDASLGRFGLQGYGAVFVVGGEPIEATGVMKTIRDKVVLLVRSVRVGGETYNIRSERGVALSPRARQLAAQKMGAKEEAR